MIARSTARTLAAALCLLMAACLSPVAVRASDITLFGGIQHQGKLTFQSAPGTASNFIQTFDPMTFGVFGARFSHGRVIGGEHTFAIAPNFIDSGSRAIIYNSNLRVEAPLPVVKPYASAGGGLIHTSGSAASFGSAFALNYGGGTKVMAGPLGVGLDVRGYTLPKITVSGFQIQQRLNFVQVSAGVVVSFK